MFGKYTYLYCFLSKCIGSGQIYIHAKLKE